MSSHDSRDRTRNVVDTVQVENLRARLSEHLEQSWRGGEVVVLPGRQGSDSENREKFIYLLNSRKVAQWVCCDYRDFPEEFGCSLRQL